MEILRKCKCGKTATENELNLFTKDKASKYGRANMCKECHGVKYKGKYKGPRIGPREIHGETGTRIHRIWTKMRTRCMNSKGDKYEYYGGKGIKVCDEWNNYSNFKKWSLANGYEEHLTIDRKDSNKNYEPTNCRWVTSLEQANNKGLFKNNISGFRGITSSGKKWIAKIKTKDKEIYLGTFDFPWTASLVRDSYITINNLPNKLNF